MTSPARQRPMEKSKNDGSAKSDDLRRGRDGAQKTSEGESPASDFSFEDAVRQKLCFPVEEISFPDFFLFFLKLRVKISVNMIKFSIFL